MADKKAVEHNFQHVVMKPDQFKIIRSSVREPQRFDAAVKQILAVGESTIRNVVLQEVRSTLSRFVEEAWKKYVSEPHFYAGKRQEQTEEVQALYDSILIMGLHDVIAASNKVAKSKATGPAFDAIRDYCAEVLPLSKIVASLKNKAVKGRAPSTGQTKQKNPNKVVKTCPVCFRAIAVQLGTMALHGYQRPAIGLQTASCPGTQFKPLEVSSEGLEWLITSLRKRLVDLNQAIYPEYLNCHRHGHIEKITRDDPFWPKEFNRYIAKIESDIRNIERELTILDKKLINWKPETLL